MLSAADELCEGAVLEGAAGGEVGEPEAGAPLVLDGPEGVRLGVAVRVTP